MCLYQLSHRSTDLKPTGSRLTEGETTKKGRRRCDIDLRSSASKTFHLISPYSSFMTSSFGFGLNAVAPVFGMK